jgi:twinkle protein
MSSEGIKKLYYKFNEFEYKTTSKERVLSGIEELDWLTKGFELGCVTIWTGLTNAGKTTVLTMVTKQTIQQGHKVFYFNGEQTKDDFKNNLYKQSVSADDLVDVYYPGTYIKDTFVKPEKVQELNKIYGENLFLYNNNESRKIDVILAAMWECYKQHNTKVFILDNFMQIDMSGSDIYTEQSNIMERLRTFAVNYNVHIHLVAHPRKIERFQTRLSLYDISGTMNMANKAYNIISIMRVDSMDKDGNEYKKLEKELFEQKYDITRANTILEVLKTKGTACGLVPLKFIKETKTYEQLPKMYPEQVERMKYQAKQKPKEDDVFWKQGEIPF